MKAVLLFLYLVAPFLFFSLAFASPPKSIPDYVDQICKDDEWRRDVTYQVGNQRLTAECVGNHSIVIVGKVDDWREIVSRSFFLASHALLIPIIALIVDSVSDCEIANQAKYEIDTMAEEASRQFQLQDSIPYMLGLVGPARKICVLTNA